MLAREDVPSAVGDADYTLALQWEGTYLAWLNDAMLRRILDPFLGTLAYIQLHLEYWPDLYPTYEFEVERQYIDWGDDTWGWYFNRFPNDWFAGHRGYDSIEFDVQTDESDKRNAKGWARDAESREDTEYDRNKIMEQVLWFSDVLLRSYDTHMHMPFRLFPRDVWTNQTHYRLHPGPNHLTNAVALHTVGSWDNRATWYARPVRAFERVGCTFEKPQHHFFVSCSEHNNHIYFNYRGEKRALYDAHRRAFTTDLRDSQEAEQLYQKARLEWGHSFGDSNYVCATHGVAPP